MAYTTTNAIRSNLITTITGITCQGKPFGNYKFRRSNGKYDFENKSASDIDREFDVDFIERGSAIYFGSVTEVDYDGNVIIMMGFRQTSDRRDGLDRMNTDIITIAGELEKQSNYPAGVHLIRYRSSSIADVTKAGESFWIVEINFRIVFSLAL